MNKKTTFIILGIVVLAVLVAGISLKKPVTAPVEEPSVPTEVETTTPAEPSTEVPFTTGEEVVSPISPIRETGLSCVVLDEEYCEKGKRIFFPGDMMLGVGFNLPLKTKIYSPFDGVLYIIPVMIHPFTFEVIENKSTIEIIKWPIQEELQEFLLGNVIVDSKLEKELREGSERMVDFRWDIESPPVKMIKVKKGELIGEVSAEKYSSKDKEYNFWVFIRNSRTTPPYRPPEYIPDDYINLDFARQYFPYVE